MGIATFFPADDRRKSALSDSTQRRTPPSVRRGKKSALDLAQKCRCLYTVVIARTKAGNQSVHETTFWIQEGKASGARQAVVSVGGKGVWEEAVDGAHHRGAQEESKGSLVDAQNLHQALAC